MDIFEQISESLHEGSSGEVKALVTKALEEGTSPKDILEKGLLAGMSVIGELFKNNEIFVPEVLISARAMNAGTEILKPHLKESGVEAKGTAVIGTVKGDLHDIGKNLVKMMIEGKGITVIDLGVDVPADKMLDEAVNNNAAILCCSALLTTTMGEMKNVVELAKERGIRDKIKIMVGGAPVTQNFCDSVGADCFAPDAAAAAEAALEFCLNQ